jgi:hypothetical protein
MSSQRWKSDGAKSGLSGGWSKMVNLCSIHPCTHISSHIVALEENVLHVKKNSTDMWLHFLRCCNVALGVNGGTSRHKVGMYYTINVPDSNFAAECEVLNLASGWARLAHGWASQASGQARLACGWVNVASGQESLLVCGWARLASGLWLGKPSIWPRKPLGLWLGKTSIWPVAG